MKRQLSAGIIIYIEHNGIRNYLLLHYPAGHWDFPKGKMEEGETEKQTALRELKEETGLDSVEVISGFQDSIEYYFCINNETYFKTVIFFLGKVDKPSVILSHEHQGYAWLDYEKAYKRITYQNSKDILMRANKFLKKI